MKNKNAFRFIRIVFYFICFIYLLIKEPNGESLFVICPFRNLFDLVNGKTQNTRKRNFDRSA